jgi:DNA/RNA endonuclease G (NUC1)
MRLLLVRVVRPLLLALAILSCASERAVGPTLTTEHLKPALDLPVSGALVVISQVYGGGGNSGAPLNSDFIELFNPGSSAVDLTGWSVQYASATGTGSFGATATQITPLSGSIPAGGYVLVQEAGGANGTAVVGDITDPTPIAMAAGAGKVALVNTPNPLGCNGSSTPCDPVALGQIVDLVGYGTANFFEGSVAPTLTNTTAAFRKDHGCQDTNRNGDDFVTGVPSPRKLATAIAPCVPVEPPGPVASVTISPAGGTVFLGTTKQFTALGTDAAGRNSPTTFAWTSSNDNVVRFNDPAVGLASTPGGQGTVTITATAANGVAGSTTVFVTESGGAFSITIAVNTPRQAPVGYTKPAFPTVRDADNAVISPPPRLTWSSSDQTIATVDALGYITGVAPGSVTIKATADNGVFGSTSFTVIPADAPTTAIYRNHVEFGTPTDQTPADEHLLVRRQSVSSYNKDRGGPNWVSWDINASHFGPAPRCDCFSADQTLPADFYHVVDFDYRNSGYDRGHVVQSESRTTTDQENASTFLLTNILPQGAENNQGPWSKFENYLNDRARGVGESPKEVYVIAGGVYAPNPGTLKNEGKVAIPDYTWKVAVILPAGKGLADIQTASDLEVIAVEMPNLTTPGVPASSFGIRNNPWEQYKTTVDAIETRSGYDLLSKLQDPLERIVESGNPPIAASLQVNPGRIYINGEGNGQVIITVLGSGELDAGAVDVSSIRVGTVGIDTNGNDGFKSSVNDVNNDGVADLIVHFNRDELVDDGQLAIGTTRLVLYLDMIDGRHVEAIGAVRVGSIPAKN